MDAIHIEEEDIEEVLELLMDAYVSLELSKGKDEALDESMPDKVHNVPCELLVVEEDRHEVTMEDFADLEGSLAAEEWKEKWKDVDEKDAFWMTEDEDTLESFEDHEAQVEPY